MSEQRDVRAKGKRKGGTRGDGRQHGRDDLSGAAAGHEGVETRTEDNAQRAHDGEQQQELREHTEAMSTRR
jgi:hypothetical protein